ncbi:type II secretion system protein GspD, partial [Myxococcota bacterium]|nr:type II secretion system protein GspD [Myxococcota bacterium]
PRSKTGETKKKETADLFEGEIKVTADKATNALIIVASGHDFRALRRIIEKLDIPRRQVYIEAAILEVTVNDTNERSINWHTPMSFAGKDLPGGVGGDGSFGYLQSAQNTGGISPTLAALSSPEALLGMAGGSVVGLVGKGISIPVGDSEITLPSFGLILKALQSSSSAQILSTPHILTTDNEEASIEVGQKIPFRRGTSMPNMSSLGGVAGGSSLSSLSSMSSMFSSTDRIDVSLKLTVTPQINAHNKIRLEIDQQIEDVVGREEQTQQPITANRAVKTVIVLEDQQTVVIGGLIRDRTRESESKIPLLGDLPILGWFFKQRSTEIEKVNLVLILTPYIIHDASDFQKIFERKINEYEEFAASYYGHTSKYRAHINYDRKIGPLAQIARTLRYEDAKLENGGEGQGGSTMVKPTEKSDSSSDEAKS